MKRTYIVYKNGYERKIEEHRTVVSKSKDKEMKSSPTWFDMSLFKDAF